MKKMVEVTQLVEVEVPESLFTEQFMEEFRQQFYPFETVEEHFRHLGQLRARGIYDGDSFIEGYGEAKTLGIKFNDPVVETEVV